MGDDPIKNNLIQYATLLRQNANVRYLVLSLVISLFGDWFNFIAATEVVNRLAPSGFTISLLVGIRTLAPVLGAPLAPWVVTRIRRRTFLIASDLARCFLVLGLLLVRSPDHLWLFYLLIGLQAFLNGIFFPIRTAILPNLVANEEELGAANTLSSLSWTGMIALGTALGGLVTTILGAEASFVIDAATFVLSAVCLMQLRYQPASESAHHGQSSPEAARTQSESDMSYAVLLDFLRQHKDFLWLSTKKTAVTVFSFIPTQILQILLSQRYPHIGPSSLLLGYIFSVGGLVSFFSPILVRLFTGNDHHKMRRAITYAYLLAALGMLLQAPIPPFGILLLGVALRSVGAVLIWTFSTQLILSLTPFHLRDHMLSYEFFLFNLMGILGVIMPALITEDPRLGIPGAFLILAACFLILATGWTLWLWRGTYGVATVHSAGHAE